MKKNIIYLLAFIITTACSDGSGQNSGLSSELSGKTFRVGLPSDSELLRNMNCSNHSIIDETDTGNTVLFTKRGIAAPSSNGATTTTGVVSQKPQTSGKQGVAGTQFDIVATLTNPDIMLAPNAKPQGVQLEVEMENVDDSDADGSTPVPSPGESFLGTITFNSDNTYSFTFSQETLTLNGIWKSISDDIIELTFNSESDHFYFDIDGDTIYLGMADSCEE